MKYRVPNKNVEIPSALLLGDPSADVIVATARMLRSPIATLKHPSEAEVRMLQIAANFRPSDLKLLNLIRKFQGRME